MSPDTTYMTIRGLLLGGSLSVLVLTGASQSLEPASSSGWAAAVTSKIATERASPPSAAPEHLLRSAYQATHAPVDTPSPTSLQLSDETIWLARAIYSESKRAHEQELVAWIVRNRVETEYRGKTSYKGVVMDPYQFSAFNPDAPKRSFLLNLTVQSWVPKWWQSLWIAYYVRHADPSYRPFSIETRHFYSERSMLDRSSPPWAENRHLVALDWLYLIDEDRFRFYEQIS